MQTATIGKTIHRTSALPPLPALKTKSETARSLTRIKRQIIPATRHDLKVKVEFKCDFPGAQSVAVAGTFNNWNPSRTPLKKNGAEWQGTITLARGRYEYRFVVDEKWLSDPKANESAPNPFGESNSVLSI